MIDQLETSSFSLQINEATDVVKDAHLITYVRYVLEHYIKEDFLFANLLTVDLHHLKCSG